MSPPPAMLEYWDRASEIERRHNAQTAETVAALAAKYEKPVFGDVRVWDLVERLAHCIDPSDGRMFGASQLVHVMQMLEAMRGDGVDDPDMLVAAIVHDLGKLLLLVDEDPANVVCMTVPIGEQPAGIGLDHAVLQWNHDEFGYMRLAGHASEPVTWLVRYHSMMPECWPLMNEHDRVMRDKYLVPFAHYDNETKSTFNLPVERIDSYRDLVEAAFPDPIPF